jgi:hypothetical protein
VIDPTALLGLAGVPVTTALTELVKRAVPELPARFVPLVALLFSLAINLALGARLGLDATSSLVMGLVAGLAASGLYSAGKELRA